MLGVLTIIKAKWSNSPNTAWIDSFVWASRIVLRYGDIASVSGKNAQPHCALYTALGHTHAVLDGDIVAVSPLSPQWMHRCHTLCLPVHNRQPIPQLVPWIDRILRPFPLSVTTWQDFPVHQPPHVSWCLTRLVTCQRLPPHELFFLGTMLMNSNDRTIDHQIRKVGILWKCHKNSLPASAFGPTVITGKRGMPVAKVFRQIAPVRQIHKTASINKRLCLPVTPQSPGLPASKGAILSHWSSRNNVRLMCLFPW